MYVCVRSPKFRARNVHIYSCKSNSISIMVISIWASYMCMSNIHIHHISNSDCYLQTLGIHDVHAIYMQLCEVKGEMRETIRPLISLRPVHCILIIKSLFSSPFFDGWKFNFPNAAAIHFVVPSKTLQFKWCQMFDAALPIFSTAYLASCLFFLSLECMYVKQ